MMAEGAALVDSMDWAAGSVIEDGSAEAAGAEDAIVRAVLELPGGGQQRGAEDAIEYLWRCGTLRDAALRVDALPLLKRAVDAGAAQCKGKECPGCDEALAHLLAQGLRNAGGGAGGHAGAGGSGSAGADAHADAGGGGSGKHAQQRSTAGQRAARATAPAPQRSQGDTPWADITFQTRCLIKEKGRAHGALHHAAHLRAMLALQLTMSTFDKGFLY